MSCQHLGVVAIVGVVGVVGACGDATGELGQCPIDAAASGASGSVESTATELWRWAEPEWQPTSAIVDDDAIYWYQDDGAIWRFAKGASTAELLRPKQEPPVWLRGFIADDERLYWGEAALLSGVEPAPVPPYRLWSADKGDFEPRLLLENASAPLLPSGASGGSIYAQRGDFGGPYVRVPSDGGGAFDAPEIPLGARLYGDRFYWFEPGSNDALGELWRGRLSDPTPYSLGLIERSELDVGPDHVLWHRARHEQGPPAVLYESFVVIDERRSCSASMPAAGESISFATAVDADHVYWHSYNKLGGIEVGTDGRQSSPAPDYPLYRMNLVTSRVERVETPGFSAPNHSFIVGQDAENIYVSTPEALVSIRKPNAR